MNLGTKIIKNYSNLIAKHKNRIKKTWEVIKYSIGKAKCNKKISPKKS